MASGKTVAARNMTYNGVNLTSPAPVAMAPAKATGMVAAGPGGQPSFSIQDAINAAQTGQNAANTANNNRYNQGLGVLSGGMANSRGMISSALADTANLGNVEKNAIAKQETQGHSSTQQSAINRGIGNTTVVDSLQRGVTDTANTARTGVDDMVSKNRSAINLQGAQNENQGANSIASFIAARNDVAPALKDYAALVSAAGQAPTGAKNTATITKGSINDPINLGSSSNGIVTPSAGGALGTGASGAAGGGASMGGASSSASGGGGGGGGGGQAGQYYSGAGTVAQALTPPAAGGADPNYSPGMAAAGYAKGSISITPSSAPGQAQSSLPPTPCRQYNWIADNGLDPQSSQFCH